MDLLLIDVVLRMEIIEISLTMRSASIVDLIMLIYDKYIYIYGDGSKPSPFLPFCGSNRSEGGVDCSHPETYLS